jgi:hypothetical protein
MTDFSSRRTQLLLAGTIYAFLMVLAYVVFYRYEPFGNWNRLILDSVTVLSALTCAITLTVIVTYYQPGEPPRQIWLYFSIALWLWTLGEVVWAGYDLILGEVPDTMFGDAFYFIGYIFFTLALASQFRLVLFTPSRKVFWVAAATWLAMILVTCLVMLASKSPDLTGEFLAYFYPVGDLAIGVAALVLVYTFRRGALARPWLSLLAFVVSDSLYLWATTQDIYAWQGGGGSVFQEWITLGVETIYIVAYMIMFWGVFQQYLTLRFGAVITERDTQPIKGKSA